MKSKTLKELRSLAKKSGLAGYSRMTKETLLRQLASGGNAAATDAPPSTQTERMSAATTTPSASATARVNPTAAPPPSWEEPPRHLSDDDARTAAQEQQVERAKYALGSNGAAIPAAPTDLAEDINRLPVLNEPMLCLLPQKPGVLHAYWVLPEGGAARASFKLRLCRLDGATGLEIYEEIALPASHGNWYFHVPEALANHEAIVQLGYERDGRFVSAMTRGVTSPPTRYASDRTDPAWWLSEDDFRQLYLRAGGVTAGSRRYGWSAFGSSPGAAPSEEQERPTWPGGVSSPTK